MLVYVYIYIYIYVLSGGVCRLPHKPQTAVAIFLKYVIKTTAFEQHVQHVVCYKKVHETADLLFMCMGPRCKDNPGVEAYGSDL